MATEDENTFFQSVANTSHFIHGVFVKDKRILYFNFNIVNLTNSFKVCDICVLCKKVPVPGRWSFIISF